MNWRKFQRHLKSTFAIILANHLLLVANLMMIVFSCKKELKEHLTIPKENKSKIFFVWNGIFSTDAHLSAKKYCESGFFFLCSFITFIFRWKVSELIINGVKRQDDGLYECQARNEGGQFFKSGHIQVRRNRMYILRPKPNCFWWRNYVENYYLYEICGFYSCS